MVPPAIDETLAMANLKIQKAKLGSHTISPNGKTAAESLEILKRMEADRDDKIATEKAKEERLAQAHALKLTKMSAIEREEYDRNLAAVQKAKQAKETEKVKKEQEKAVKDVEKKEKAAAKAFAKGQKALAKETALALAVAADQ